jgi:hypothetical protein
MIDIQEIKTENVQEIINMLLEKEQIVEISVPKSTLLYFSEQSAIAHDYALLAYVGQRLKDLSDTFSYNYVSPDKHESVFFRITANNVEELAATLMELSYNFNNENYPDEYIPFEDMYDYINKVHSLNITPACVDFIDVFNKFADRSEIE